MDLTINLVSVIGSGRSNISAYDDALMAAGVHNVNLISLSSVIPPRSHLVFKPLEPGSTGFGDRMYCVQAVSCGAEDPFYVACLSWVRFRDGSGLLSEHHTSGREVRGCVWDVTSEAERTMNEMLQRRGIGGNAVMEQDHRYTVARRKEPDEHACALCIATYSTEGW